MRVDLLPHNQEAYEKIRKAIAEGKKKIAISHATGSGKSYLISKLFEDYSENKKLVLVPSTYIRDQIQELFDKYSIQNVDVLLYQKLIKMSDEDIAAMDYGVIALDEYHHDTSKIWGEKVSTLLKTHPKSIIFGTSATPVRSDGINTIDELFEGNCASDLPLSESIAKKIVPLPKYVGALYTLDDELEKLRKKVESSTNTKEEKEEFYKKINAMRSQIEKSYGMPIILNKHISNREGKYIVFCKNKKHLADIKGTVIGWFKTARCKNINAYVVHSSYENKDAEYKAFCEDTSHNLKLLFCVNMLNEGLHLENISGVLLLRPTGSMLIYLQQIGRAIEANNTNTPMIIDAVNNFSAVSQGMKLLKEIKNAVAKEKENDPNFDDSGLEDIDTFFVLEQVLEVQKMFAQIEERLEGGKWTEEEIEILRKYYPIEGIKVIDRLRGKTKKMIHSKASSMNLISPRTWTKEDDELIKKYYLIEGKRIIKRFKYKSYIAIKARAQKLGVLRKEIWTKRDDNVLRQYYPSEGSNICKRLDNKSRESCRNRALKLGVQYISWTNEEDEIVKDVYFKYKGNNKEKSKEIQKRIERKSIIAIENRIRKLGLNNCDNKASKMWTDKEDEILRKYYSFEGSKVVNKLIDRTKRQVISRARILGIKKERFYDIEKLQELINSESSKQNVAKIMKCDLRTLEHIMEINGLKWQKKEKTSKYKYVYFDKRRKKYNVEISLNGKKFYFGSYDSEDEAGKVAMKKAKEYGKII